MKYNYHLPIFSASFDYGEVEADSPEDARAKAEARIKYDFEKVNTVLNYAQITEGFRIEFDLSDIEINTEI